VNAIVHLAAKTSISNSFRDPHKALLMFRYDGRYHKGFKGI
jgi:hypothetical protein